LGSISATSRAGAAHDELEKFLFDHALPAEAPESAYAYVLRFVWQGVLQQYWRSLGLPLPSYKANLRSLIASKWREQAMEKVTRAEAAATRPPFRATFLRESIVPRGETKRQRMSDEDAGSTSDAVVLSYGSANKPAANPADDASFTSMHLQMAMRDLSATRNAAADGAVADSGWLPPAVPPRGASDVRRGAASMRQGVSSAEAQLKEAERRLRVERNFDGIYDFFDALA